MSPRPWRRARLLLALGVSLLLLPALSAPAAAQKKKDDKPPVQRKAKRVKALSLAAQNHIIKVTKVLEKYGDLGDAASAVQQAAKQAAKDIKKWQKQLADADSTDAAITDAELTDKQKDKIRHSIAAAKKQIAAAPARVEQLQKSALAQIGKAEPILDKMRSNIHKLQSQDKAAMWNYYGYVYAILEKFEQARDAYESLLAEAEVADNLRLQAMYSSAQLSMLLEEYKRGVKLLEEWFDFSVSLGRTIRPGDHFLLAQGYYSLRRYKDVIIRLDLAFDLAAKAGAPPKESWLRLLVATHFAAEDYRSARPPLELLVLLHPKREYWLQLQGTYGELELREKQLAILSLAWQQGLLERDSEFISLAEHLQYAQDPLQAALIMEEGIEKEIIEVDFNNMKRVAAFWQRAQETEKALAWYRKADKVSEDGEIQYRIALLLNLENRLAESVKAARKAYKKGDFANKQEARLLIGQGLLELGQAEDALEVFQAIAEDGQEERVASWIDYTEKQLQATKAIQDTIELYGKQEKAILARIRAKN